MRNFAVVKRPVLRLEGVLRFLEACAGPGRGRGYVWVGGVCGKFGVGERCPGPLMCESSWE